MNHNPLIIIPGPTVSPLHITDDNGNKTKQVWPAQIDKQAITDTLKNSLLKMVLTKKDSGFSDNMAEIFKDIIEPLSVNEDGTKKYNIKTVNLKRSLKNCTEGTKIMFNKAIPSEGIANAIGEENIYLFTYDMFGDIFTVAKELNDYISYIKTVTNAEKADILCISLGGAVLKAYLCDYSNKNDINKIISIASLMNGSSLVADIFESKIVTSDIAALFALAGDNANTLTSLTKMLPSDAIENTAKKCTALAKDKLINNCTMMWACIPDDRFDAIYSSFIKSGSELDNKVSKLHNYSKNLNTELRALYNNGMKFYQFCGCGKELISITKNNKISSDGIVDATLASFGAKFSNVDSEPDYFGCLFTDTTWFYKNNEHFNIQKNNDLLTEVAKILAENR